LQQAIREELIYRNPVELTDPYRKQAGEKTSVQPAWSKEEALAALRAARDSEFDLFLNIALFTGMRRGEILGLIWDEVDIDRAEISITGTLKELRKVLPFGQAVVVLKKDSPKTQASMRTVGLPWPVAQAIMRHREFQKLRQLENPNWQQSNFVFTSSTGTAVYPSNFLSRFKKFLAVSGLRQIRIHDLRHTMAQLALAGGVRIEAVSETLGHTRIDTTKTIYASRVSQLAIDAPHQLAELLIDFEGEFGLSPEIEITKRKSSNNLDGA
jgi:integrase